MESKFKKYWLDIPNIFSFACVMHPRFKIKGAKLMLDTISNNLGISTQSSPSQLRTDLEILFSSYQNKYSDFTPSSYGHMPSSSGASSSSTHRLQFMANINAQLDSDVLFYGSEKNELDDYLETRYKIPYDDDFDILGWWKTNEPQYPILSKMARDLLTPPVSTVASESAFSAGGRVYDDRRGSLAPDLVEALICMKDWFDAVKRDQQREDAIAEEFKQLEFEN